MTGLKRQSRLWRLIAAGLTPILTRLPRFHRLPSLYTSLRLSIN